jgi:chromate transporter
MGAFAGAIVALNAGYASIIGIAVCWLALFLPGILMIYAVLPWWGAFRSVAVYRRCSHSLAPGPSAPSDALLPHADL